MLDSGARVWILGEFCATLDRETAKVVAFCLQKVARKTGKTAIVATTHLDLVEDLGPSVLIEKRFGEEVETTYIPNKPIRECSIVKDIVIHEASWSDYKSLGHFHYRSGTPIIRKTFKMMLHGRIIGVIVYSSSSHFRSIGRETYFGRKIASRELERDFRIISRVIIHPKYRSIGLGARLVRETLPLVGVKYVEAIAVMAKYTPFFEKAGMVEVPEAFRRKGKKYYVWINTCASIQSAA